MDKDIKCKILIELLRAMLEIENLKPFVGDSQLEASNKIKDHLAYIAEIVGNQND